jgi:SAM-dependent methyltransferase
MSQIPTVPAVDLETLRCEIRKEYREVASDPHHGFHFHTGRTLAKILEYDEELLDGVPEGAIESFAGTGNPFSLGEVGSGARVVDIGSGAGIDSLIAGKLVGDDGRVIGVDMTPEMLDKARAAAAEGGFGQVEFRRGFAEQLPIDDGWADVVISNGVLNLCPDKVTAYREAHRVLRPGGRLQVADILVTREVPAGAKRQIDLWTG